MLKLYILYRSPNIDRVSRRLKWARHVARMEEGRSAFKILTATSAGKISLGRPRRRWVSIRGIGLIGLRIEIIGEPL